MIDIHCSNTGLKFIREVMKLILFYYPKKKKVWWLREKFAHIIPLSKISLKVSFHNSVLIFKNGNVKIKLKSYIYFTMFFL